MNGIEAIRLIVPEPAVATQKTNRQNAGCAENGTTAGMSCGMLSAATKRINVFRS